MCLFSFLLVCMCFSFSVYKSIICVCYSNTWYLVFIGMTDFSLWNYGCIPQVECVNIVQHSPFFFLSVCILVCHWEWVFLHNCAMDNSCCCGFRSDMACEARGAISNMIGLLWGFVHVVYACFTQDLCLSSHVKDYQPDNHSWSSGWKKILALNGTQNKDMYI